MRAKDTADLESPADGKSEEVIKKRAGGRFEFLRFGGARQYLNRPVKVKKAAKSTKVAGAAKRGSLPAVLSAFALRYAQPLVARLAPLAAYYRARSRREQVLILAGAGLAASWLLWAQVVSPYVSYRESLRAAYRDARLEYAWLEEQIPRLDSLLKQRGSRKDLLGDPAEFVRGRLADARVSVGDDGVYTVAWKGGDGKKFFAVIGAMTGYGVSLKSISVKRGNAKSKDAEFSASLK